MSRELGYSVIINSITGLFIEGGKTVLAAEVILELLEKISRSF